ncbi:MAG: sigma-54 dependent transcriptional regulator [Planctomycetota bacterium]
MSESEKTLAPKERLLVVDDEEAMRFYLQRLLKKRGFDVEIAADGAAARRLIQDQEFDLLLTDIRMPEVDGLALLQSTKVQRPGLPVIVMTGYGSIPDAIAALKAGADNYITKPFDREEILKVIGASLRASRLSAENQLLKRLLAEGRRFEGMVGTSPPMQQLYREIDIVAGKKGVVLIKGESGTGKELVARAIHARSPRHEGPFQAFHCAAVPVSLVAAELFGVEEGAYTGATVRRDGVCRRADGGTLFLDEIAEAPLEVQPALLRLLQSGEVSALGSSETSVLDLRIVAATHRDLKKRVEDNLFRQDLFFRFNVFSLTVPPLRKRRADIGELINHSLALHGRDEDAIDLEARALLEDQDWPGNVRQLQNVIERMLALGTKKTLGVDAVPEDCLTEPREVANLAPFREAVTAFEAQYLLRLLRSVQGNVSEAARRAGISRPTLHAKIQSLGIDPDEFR